MHKKFFVGLCFVTFIGAGSFYYVQHVYPLKIQQQQSQTISTIYGSVEVSDPVVLEILRSDAMERLKHINQYGIMAFIKPEQKYNRYEHSLGVFYLLRLFGAPLEEQVAGLLHDVSHTTFSHVADFLHETHLNKYSYQDTILKSYLEKTGLLAILKKHGMERVADMGKTVEYKMLKDDLPNLCADRLEYNLYGGYLEGWLTPDQMRLIVSKIVHKDGKWIFTDEKAAELFAQVSIDLSVQNWSSPENAFVSTLFASLLKRGFFIGVVTEDDFHFSTDQVVWEKLRASDDPEIQKGFLKLDNYKTSYRLSNADKYDLHFKGKFRGVDPLVLRDGKMVQLTQTSPEFADYLKRSHLGCKEHYILYT